MTKLKPCMKCQKVPQRSTANGLVGCESEDCILYNYVFTVKDWQKPRTVDPRLLEAIAKLESQSGDKVVEWAIGVIYEHIPEAMKNE